jgi:DMSO/TMAO reductase YedYZ molybdopterin-dependent catalytic subunit
VTRRRWIDLGAKVSISAEVEHPGSPTAAELESLVDGELVADVHCREGWSGTAFRASSQSIGSS